MLPDTLELNKFSSKFASWQDAPYFSLVTIATVGYGDITPVGDYEKWLVMWEITIGILFFGCIVSLLISRIARFGHKS